MLFGIELIFVVKTLTAQKIFRSFFQNLVNIDFIRGDFSQEPADCIICPGDSYGLMETNISYRVDQMLNSGSYIRNVIENMYYGEQPVGTCVLVPTGNDRYKFVAHVPLYRVSKDISETHNIYIAFRAALTAVLNHNKVCDIEKTPDKKIKTVLCTPLSTDLDIKEVARQMSIAYRLTDISMKCSKENSQCISKFLE